MERQAPLSDVPGRFLLLRRAIGIGLLLAIAVGCTVVYSHTFQGHLIRSWTHGPFNFECGIYKSYAERRYNLTTTGNDKLQKHFLCAVGYPLIHTLLQKAWLRPDTIFVCPLLAGGMLFIFGCWLYPRSHWSPVTFVVLLLFGFSFTTWYSASVWESRAFIGLGAVILLIMLDRFLLRPRLSTLVLASLAMIFSILITIGNANLLVLLPVSVLSRFRKIGFRKALSWALISSLAVMVSVVVVYQACGFLVNPRLKLGGMVKLSLHERKHIKATVDRFSRENYTNVAIQALVYSVGGIMQPTVTTTNSMNDLWWGNEVFTDYFSRPIGALFIICYLALLILVLLTIILKNLIFREPIFIVMALWFLIYISFFVYFNPFAGPVYAAELQPVLWGLIGLTLSRLRPRWWLIILVFLLVSVFLNNYRVMDFFRRYYDTSYKSLITGSRLKTRRMYFNWVWAVKPEKKTGDRVRVEIAHAAPGDMGYFRIIAWADDNGDGKPDREIACSEIFQGSMIGDWSVFEFSAPEERIFIGNEWDPKDDIWLFRAPKGWPSEYPLEDRFYYNVSPRSRKDAGPAITNLKVRFIN